MARKASKRQAPKFPKTIYVNREGEKDEEYLVANETVDPVDDGAAVAVYELVEVRAKRVSHTLE